MAHPPLPIDVEPPVRPGNNTRVGYLIVVRYPAGQPCYLCFTIQHTGDLDEQLFTPKSRNTALAWLQETGCSHYKEMMLLSSVFRHHDGAGRYAARRDRYKWNKARRIPKFVREGRY